VVSAIRPGLDLFERPYDPIARLFDLAPFNFGLDAKGRSRERLLSAWDEVLSNGLELGLNGSMLGTGLDGDVTASEPPTGQMVDNEFEFLSQLDSDSAAWLPAPDAKNTDPDGPRAALGSMREFDLDPESMMELATAQGVS
jgi:hypothetical protein